MIELESTDEKAHVPAPATRLYRSRVAVSVVLSAAILISGTAMAMGTTPFPFLLSVCISVAISLRPRIGGQLAIPVAVISISFAVFGLLLVSGTLGAHLVAVQVAGLGLLGLVAAAFAAVDTRTLELGPNRARVAILGCLTGPGVWLLGMAGAWRRDPSYAIAWTMSGDARPNFLGSRLHADQGGILLHELRGAPVSQGFVSVFMAPGRKGFEGIDLLLHDVVRMAQAWTIFITLTCLFSGLLAGFLTRSDAPLTRFSVSAGASLVPLSWYVLGSGLENGFLNASLTLALTSATWIIVAFAHHARMVAITALMAGLVLLLETWYPMATLPSAMLVAVLLTWTMAPGTTRRHKALTATAGVFFIAVTAGLVGLPLLSEEVELTLAMEGGIYGLPKYFFLVAGGIAVVLAAGAVHKRSGTTLFWACTFAVAAGLGMEFVLLWTRRASPLIWGYYPVKFAWLLSSAFLMVVVALLGARLSAAPAAHQRGIGFLAGCLAALAMGATLTVVPGAANPVRFMLLGWGGPNGIVVDEVIDASERGPNRVLWNYYDAPNDRIGNFWLTVASATMPEALPWAYTHDPASLESLCSLGAAGPFTAVTRDPNLEASLEETCPDSAITVEIPS